jgi:hypothetical protein
MLLGNLIPRICTQLPLVSQTGKSVGTGESKPGGEREVAGLATAIHEISGLGSANRSKVVFRERGCQ